MQVVRGLEGSTAAAKKQYNMRMVSSETSERLSGFEHNAVTPLGMLTPMPIILSAPIKDLPDGQVWLGGGEPDLKLSIDIKQFVAVFQAALGGLPVEFADVVG